MTTSDVTQTKPLWLSMEERILQLDIQALSGENLEASIQRIASELDDAGYNVSRRGGNMINLRFAVDKARQVGKPLLKDSRHLPLKMWLTLILPLTIYSIN